MSKATADYWYNYDDLINEIVIVDLDKGNKSVTNDIENVIC